MKQKLIVMFLFIMCTIGAHAQKAGHDTKTTWGIKAETNLSGFFISETSAISSSMNVGVTAGWFVNFEFNDYWALQGNLLFHYKESALDRQNLPGKYTYWGSEIAIYAMFQRKFQRGDRIYVGLGPYSDFGFDARLKRGNEKIDLYKKDGASEVSAMQDFDSGFGILLGYEFRNGVQINAGYKVGVTNILDANSSEFKLIPHSVTLGIGFRFK